MDVVDNSGRHEARTMIGDVTLSSGAHAVLIEYARLSGPYAIDWQWRTGEEALSDVPGWTLTPRRTSYAAVLAGHAIDVAIPLLLAIAAASVLAWLFTTRAAIVFAHPRAATLGLFVALAVANTWPLGSDPGHLTRHDNRDTMLNEWIVAWVAHQAPRDPIHLFDANIFLPEHDTLAYSEPMIPQAAMGAPLLWLGASPVLVHGLLILAGLALSGWSMCLVLRSWTGSWTAGIIAGSVFAFNAHVLSRIPHLQAQHVEFLPAALFALDALLTRGGLRHAARFVVFVVLQSLASIHLLVFTVFAMAAAVLSRPADWTGARAWPAVKNLGAAIAAAAVLLGPFLLPYYRAAHDQGLTRSLSDAAMYAATWRDYLSTPARIHYALWSHQLFEGTALFPGAIGVVLTGLAIARGGALRDPRARMCLAVGAIGVLLSFGPTLPGYATLYQVLPLLRAIRGTARFGYLAVVAVSAAAGFGMITLRSMVSARAWRWMAPLVVLLVWVESFAGPLGLVRFEGIPPIYRAPVSDAAARVVEIPFFGPRSAQFHASYMLNSTAHWKPIVNGYSGFQPASFFSHADVLEHFPDDRSIALLHDLKITHVFVHVDQLPPETRAAIAVRPELTLADRFGGIDLYRVK